MRAPTLMELDTCAEQLGLAVIVEPTNGSSGSPGEIRLQVWSTDGDAPDPAAVDELKAWLKARSVGFVIVVNA